VREPKRGKHILVGRIGGGKSSEIAVGEGQHDNIARCLAEIGRLDDIIECR